MSKLNELSHPSQPGLSRLEKAPTGIEGFDEITGGGLPRGRTTLVMGDPGAGKTIFALQTLVLGARLWNEPGIFVAFEESAHQLRVNAAGFSWDLASLDDDQLLFVEAQLSPDTIHSGGFDLTGLLAGLRARCQGLGARRIVFDGLDILLMHLDDPLVERQEVYRLHTWLAESGLTGILTAKLENAEAHSPRYRFLQYMADCVISLHNRLLDRVALRELRVLKYRGSAFLENVFPMVIGPGGLEVGALPAAEGNYAVSSERVSSGVPRLDTMLDGGYYRGTSVLITGLPGTAKSTLAGAFTLAACERGERTLYISFDEVASEIVRNLTSVGLHLEPHLRSGLLRMASARTEAKSAEEHLMALRDLMRAHQARCMVIDPLSAMTKAGGAITALAAVKRLLHLAKSMGLTLVCTSLLDHDDSEIEATPIQISTVADTWIHLSYVVRGGERNRSLTVVKSRGTRHSNQVRELILSDEGVTLADVYTAEGEVLMGTARWQKERAEAHARELKRAEVNRRRRSIAVAEAEVKARLEILRHELEVKRAELAVLESESTAQEAEWAVRQEELYRLRRGDSGLGARPPGSLDGGNNQLDGTDPDLLAEGDQAS